MILLPHPAPISQPQGRAEIDWSNPLTRGLVDAVFPGLLRTARGVAPTALASSTTSEAHPLGIVRRTSGNSSDVYPGIGKNLPVPLTHLYWVIYLNTTANRDGGNYVPGSYGFGFLSNTNLRAIAVTSGGANNILTFTALTVDRPYVLVHTVNAANHSLYADGARIVGPTALSGAYVPATGEYRVHNGADVVSASDKIVILSAVWNRELSADEIARLSRNPWQLFTRPRHRSFVPVGASTGGTTISAGVGESAASGLQAGVVTATTINADIGAAAGSGLAASVVTATTVSAGVGQSAASGLQAGVAAATTISAGIGAAAGSGLAASVVTATTISAAVGEATATGRAATVTLGTGVTVGAGVGQADASGRAAGVITATAIAAGVAAAEAAGLGAQIVVGTTVAAGLGAAAGSGVQATVTSSEGTSIAGGIGSAAALGLAATITAQTTFVGSYYRVMVKRVDNVLQVPL